MRANRERFPIPNLKIFHKQKHPLPELLEYFQDEITLPWLDLCTENLADLTVKFARHEMVSNLIPKVAATIETVVDEDGNVTDQPSSEGHEQVDENNSNARQRIIRDCLLQGSHEVRISISTTWCWLR